MQIHVITSAVSVCLCLIILILTIVCNWKIFEKAGHAGWKSLIPFLACVTRFKIAKMPGLLVITLILPPIYGILNIVRIVRTGKYFGMSTGLCILSIFIPLVELLGVAFNPYAEYDF